MSNDLLRWTAVDRYISSQLVPTDPALDAALEASCVAGLPPHNVARNQGKLLELLVRMLRARRVLEIGTLGAYSTIWLARGLPPDGKIVTLEADKKHAAVARGNLERAGLASVVELREGRALDTLPLLAAESSEPFELVFIDADKPSNPEYFQWALRLGRVGTLIVVDNVVRDGAVIDENGDASVQGVRRLNQLIAAEPRVTATALQTVGEKGYDGFALVLVVA